MLQAGLYEQLINRAIRQELGTIAEERQAKADVAPAEAPRVLADYVSAVLKQELDRLLEQGRSLDEQVELVNAIVELIRGSTKEPGPSGLDVEPPPRQLLALLAANDPRLAISQTARSLPRPETSLARSSLFTGARQEPPMFTELKKEIASAERIDLLVSFIRFSGLRLLLPELEDFTKGGGQLRVITTSYMGATDLKSVETLAALSGTELRISYDTKRTRLHAKAYMFYRNTGFHTAYVGSSNLTNPAISSGLEWNLKLTAQDQPETLEKIAATFKSYWETEEFEPYTPEQKDRLRQALEAERHTAVGGPRPLFFDVRPYPYQQEILDRLRLEREVRGYWKNLVVAATGTGKTVISALDYRGFCRSHPGEPCRLLFVAHREEILRQSLQTFQGVLRDPNFGDLMVGGTRPQQADHLFLSVQSLHSQKLCEKLPADFYDYIVVDEFHHAAAPTYQDLLTHFQPKVLLGLTATPERLDGKNILDWFAGRIAAEIRLPEAIERRLLCPFQYFGVSDDVDLSQVKWLRGGYDRAALSNLYSFTAGVAKQRADNIVRSLDRYVADLNDVKGLGFCVSVEHAHFMADHFNLAGIPSLALTGQSGDEERRTARQKLVSGELCFLFVVDIYNEGVDIPEVNTVLFLRPTESLTIFLQQLGRGLRLCPGKECLTVLDFIGQANKKYSFEEKFRSLLTDPRQSLPRQIRNGFVSVPKGCFIQLERKASQAILDNIRAAYRGKRALVGLLSTFQEDTGLPLTLRNFLGHYHLEPEAIYDGKSTFVRLCVAAGVRPDFAPEPAEEALTKGLSRLVRIDSRRWLRFLLRVLPHLEGTDFARLPDVEKRMLQMFCYTIWLKGSADWTDPAVLARLNALAESPLLLEDLLDLLRCRLDAIDFLDEPVELGFACPLDLHCTYTRDQILTAMDFLTPSNVREGVKWLPEKQLDVFFVTLNKSEKEYSPTTMYQDYFLRDDRFHWQSQSTTSEDSPTGQRYIHHQELGSRIALFVRERKKDALGAAPYTFLGTASYLSHTGSCPMNITWKLDRPIPTRYRKSTDRREAG